MPQVSQNLGPQSFSLKFTDSYDTKGPNDPLAGVQVELTVPIVVPWTLSRTQLEADKAVKFGPLIWTGAGEGPHDLYEDVIGGTRRKVGTVQWGLVLKVEEWVQENGKSFRNVVTVDPHLTLTITKSGFPKEIVVRQTQPNPCYGAWQIIPESVVKAVGVVPGQSDA